MSFRMRTGRRRWIEVSQAESKTLQRVAKTLHLSCHGCSPPYGCVLGAGQMARRQHGWTGAPTGPDAATGSFLTATSSASRGATRSSPRHYRARRSPNKDYRHGQPGEAFKMCTMSSRHAGSRCFKVLVAPRLSYSTNREQTLQPLLEDVCTSLLVHLYLVFYQGIAMTWTVRHVFDLSGLIATFVLYAPPPG